MLEISAPNFGTQEFLIIGLATIVIYSYWKNRTDSITMMVLCMALFWIIIKVIDYLTLSDNITILLFLFAFICVVGNVYYGLSHIEQHLSK